MGEIDDGVEGEAPAREEPPTRLVVAMWLGVGLAPVAWFLHLMVGYVLGGYLCEGDATLALHLATVVALALSGAGVLAAWRFWRSLPRDGMHRGGTPLTRERFMAVSGMTMSAFFMLVIAVAELGNVFLDPCGGS